MPARSPADFQDSDHEERERASWATIRTVFPVVAVLAFIVFVGELLLLFGPSLPRPFRWSGSPLGGRYNSLESLVGYWAVLGVPFLILVWGILGWVVGAVRATALAGAMTIAIGIGVGLQPIHLNRQTCNSLIGGNGNRINDEPCYDVRQTRAGDVLFLVGGGIVLGITSAGLALAGWSTRTGGLATRKRAEI